GREELPAAEERLRRRLEPIVLEPHERAAQQRQPVEHLPAEQDGPRLAGEVLVAVDVELVIAPAERAPETVPAAAPQEHREVELADVPSRQHVGIDAADVREQLDEQRALVGEDLRAWYGPFADHPDALAAGAPQRAG